MEHKHRINGEIEIVEFVRQGMSPWLLIENNTKLGDLTIHPTRTFDNKLDFQFENIHTIVLDGSVHEIRSIELEPLYDRISGESYEVVKGMPQYLGKRLDFGLSIPLSSRFFFKSLDDEGKWSTIVFHQGENRIEDRTIYINFSNFQDICTTAEANRTRASDVAAKINAYNIHCISARAQGLEPKSEPLFRLETKKFISKSIQDSRDLDGQEVDQLAQLISSEASPLSKANPALVVRVQKQAELVNLMGLIDKFESEIHKEKNNEEFWQEFFNNNNFALQQLFGHPTVWVTDDGHAQVRAPKSDGKGAEIVDFLLMNPITKEGLVVEIKTPKANLMHKGKQGEYKPYRGKGSSSVCLPSRDLQGSVSQALSQVESLQRRIHGHLEQDDPLRKIQFGSASGAVIIGNYKTLTDNEKRSFKLFRESHHNLVILTYDEVLERLRTLVEFLKGEGSGA
ncbi:Shedu anti-phage system protein SduA domain-containing protein [Micrococcus luteus]|uniref:Shedu anti-phage system protein SduA domain-containing protein n=2 Tax=Micrococcus luteus TaxID=1270 RepID=UPI001E4CD617|nr:Shedu anti-phage system protein SduA domain-containing protein [Micrococcus luteus]MCD0173131.1 DUF4263 domain-containing protein [Micrococcus luteus]